MKKVLYFTVGIILLSNVFFNANIIKISAASTFWDGFDKTGGAIGYKLTDPRPLAEKIGKILSISTIFLGVVFLGMMIYAGYLWMLARGNEQEVEKAKNIIIYAVIGLVVVLAAYAITQLMAVLWEKS